VVIPGGFRRNIARPSCSVEKEFEGEIEMNGGTEPGLGFPEGTVTEPEGNVVKRGVHAEIRGMA